MSAEVNMKFDRCSRKFSKCIIQLQLTSLTQIMEQVKVSQADMPSDFYLPIPTSANYLHISLRIIFMGVLRVFLYM
jgi:hypothetical protein